MIPPLHVRQIRACEDCVFYDNLEELCILHEDISFPEKIERWEYNEPAIPCPYHFTPDEIIEQIETISCIQNTRSPNGKIWMAQ